MIQFLSIFPSISVANFSTSCQDFISHSYPLKYGVSQSSTFVPLSLLQYLIPLGGPIYSFDFSYHHADKAQIYSNLDVFPRYLVPPNTLCTFLFPYSGTTLGPIQSLNTFYYLSKPPPFSVNRTSTLPNPKHKNYTWYFPLPYSSHLIGHQDLLSLSTKGLPVLSDAILLNSS